MATIEFIIRDAHNRGIGGVSAVARCEFKNKQTWQSEPLTADDNGVARLAMDNTQVSRFNWQTLRLDLRHNDKPLAHAIAGQTKTGPGSYRVEVSAFPEGEALPPQTGTPPTGDTPPGDLPRPPQVPGRPPKIDRYDVRGTVKADDGRPLSKLLIRVVDKGIGKEKELGKSLTEATGNYSVAYKRADLLYPEAGSANLIVRVYAGEAAQTPLAASPMKQAARAHAVIDLIVDRKTYRGLSLFEITATAFKTIQLDDGYETLDREDALLIAKQTGLEIGQAQRFIQAQVIARRAGATVDPQIPAMAVFGILQAGLTPTAAAFATARDARLVELLKRALTENWVGELQPQAVIDSMRPGRVKLLAETDQETVAVIRGAGADETQLLKILDAYLRSNQSLFQLLKQLGDQGELPQAAVASARDRIALWQFTGGRGDFVDALAKGHGITRPVELARLTSKEWSAAAEKYFKPILGQVEGRTQKEKIAKLADELARQVEKAFPTAVFAQQWKADGGLEKTPVQVYLEEHPDFDFATQLLQQYWEQTGKFPPADVQPQLQRAERLFHITPDYRRFPVFKACWAAGIASARDVLEKGRGRFIKHIAGFGIDARLANAIYRKAQRVSSRDLLALQPVPVAVVDEEGGGDSPLPVRVEPTIAALFGAQGGNGCPHCVSAFSPAAYLVDMLRFLQRAQTDGGVNGLELLFLRRPDIANLRLDCENSDTVMPYIDLVNEVLEHVVATSQVPFQVPLDWMVEPTLDLQTGATAEDLAAHPEHLSAEAYNRLRAITAPWALPYNLWSDEVRTYLAQIKVDRGAMLAALRPDENPFKVLEVAVARLKIDATEAVVLSLPADSDAKRLLIWQTADPAADLRDLRLFLKRTGLSYEQAADIFATHFVNPQHRRVLPTDLQALESATLDLKPEDNEGLLDRFHRFTRLWRKSGWSTLELDAVLSNLVTTELDVNSLAGIGIVAEIGYHYGTPVEELACWYGDMNTYGSDSRPALYQRSFLDGSVNGVVDDGAVDLLTEVFAVSGAGNSRDLVVTRPSNTHDKWIAKESPALPGAWELHPDYAPIVMAACKLTAEEMTAIIATSALLPRQNHAVALNLANLSQLFRTASLARSLGLSVQECLDWQRIMGEPLGTSRSLAQDPAQTLLLLRGISAQTDAGVSAGVLRYALLGEDVAGQAPATADIDALLAAIRSDLLKSADAYRLDAPVAQEQLRLWFSLDPTLVVDENQDDVATLMAIIDGSLAYDANFQPALDFLSADTHNRLFTASTIVNREERLLLAASEIPVDPLSLSQVDDLLREDGELADESILDLLRIFAGVSDLPPLEQTGLVSSLLPYLDFAALPSGGVDDRLQALGRALFEHWVRGPVVIQRLAAALGVTESHVELLAGAVTAGDPSVIQLLLRPAFLQEQTAATSVASRAVQRMYRQCALVKAIDLDAAALEFTLNHGQTMGLYDFRAPGAGQILNWHATLTLHELDSAVRSGEANLYQVLEEILSGELDEAGARTELAGLFGVSDTDLEQLAGAEGLNLTYPDNYLRVVGLNRLYQACGFVRQTGLPAEQVLKLADPLLNTEHAGIARAAVRTHYDETGWLKVSEQLRAGLRERQRDALLAFVLSRGALDLTHEHAYAYYLIDMDMAACFQTTRLKQAIASVQQFVQRILLGLEPANLAFTKEDAAEWQWRKNYRVWEANVKIFIYPETWLVPELRDDKTPFFKAFEQELMQGEMTNALAETAVTHYLEKLHHVSNLEIVGLYEDVENGYTLHIIARSRNTPHEYFHRTWNGETWTPWEPIEMDIEGDHIVPVVYNQRLHVFWATFSEEVNQEALEATGIEEEISDVEDRINELEGPDGLIETTLKEINDIQDTIEDLGDSWLVAIQQLLLDAHNGYLANYNAELANLKQDLARLEDELDSARENVSYQLVQMNWIVRDQDGWSSKRVAKDVLRGPESYAPDEYQFLGTTQTGELALLAVAGDFDFSQNERVEQTAGWFLISGCTGEMTVETDNLSPPPPLEVFDNSELVYTRHAIWMHNQYSNAIQALEALGVTLLSDSPDAKVFATKLHQVVSRATPFFLSSGERTFFVEMKQSGIMLNNPVNLRTANIVVGGTEKYHFSTHHHPYTCACLRQIRRYGINGLYSPDPDLQPERDAADLLRQMTLTEPQFSFDDSYSPDRAVVDGTPQDKIDFSYGAAYGQYNWEVFFHIPMMIATRLMQDRKFDEAQQWLHYIFDPTEKEGVGLQKYWKIKPFYYAQLWGDAQEDIETQIEDLDDALSLDSMIEQWEQHPFQPYAIARFRIVAFMRMTVTTYLNNLTAWGDSLFKQDTMESINEATQLYVLAAGILGERPLIIDQPAPGGQTFTVREFLDGLAMRALPAGRMPAAATGVFGEGAQGILGVIDQFCLPYNDRMLDYWDTVADRLFKIRHCLNIDGVFRLLPIYEPPIDPALLVRAAAAGLDISAVLSDLSAPRPHYRFAYLLQKASELASLTQGLGNQLLAALEKKDAEALARLRSEHEVALLKLGTALRQDAVKEAQEQILAVEAGRSAVQLRRDFYAGRQYMNTAEALDMVLRGYSWYLRTLAQIAQAAVTPLETIPDIIAGGAGMSSPVALTKVPESAEVAKSGAQVLNFFADLTQTAAGMSQTMGQYDRRQEEWDHQVTLADAELKQFEKQLAAAEIRLAMSEKELANHEKQIEYSEQAQAFLKDKFTHTELYTWLVTELSSLYFQAYQLAYDTAKHAERCYQHELGISNTGFIQFGYWDSLKKGLLAGDRLQLDLKRMETSYLENNIRELELSKTVSLAMLDPEALLRLTQTGECFFNLPEQLFDLDYPGHYFRRIKSISLTLPAVTGPFTTVSCTLTLLSDRYRSQASTGEADEDFVWNVGSIQSIATSGAQGDSGLFQLNFQDERYLPFERAGVISSWKLNLPRPDLAQFDYTTISDVLIQVNYTARDGGQAYRGAVEDRLTSSLNSLITSDGGFPLLMSIKNRFPDAWARISQADASVAQTIAFTIESTDLPYFLRNRVDRAKSLKLLIVPKHDTVLDFTGEPVVLNGETTAQVVFANDPGLGVPAAVFTGGTELGAQSLQLTPVVLQRLGDIKDLMLIAMLDVEG